MADSNVAEEVSSETSSSSDSSETDDEVVASSRNDDDGQVWKLGCTLYQHQRTKGSCDGCWGAC